MQVIEGKMKSPDAVFGLIKFYLKQLAITKAEKILFVADSTRWIWNRVPELVKALGIAIAPILLVPNHRKVNAKRIKRPQTKIVKSLTSFCQRCIDGHSN